MEPVSLSVAAVVLLASKFGEGFAKDAGDSAWDGVKRLREVVVTKFRGDRESEAALAALEAAPTEASRAVIVERIAAAVRADAVFGAELERCVSVARGDQAVGIPVAQAFDG